MSNPTLTTTDLQTTEVFTPSEGLVYLHVGREFHRLHPEDSRDEEFVDEFSEEPGRLTPFFGLDSGEVRNPRNQVSRLKGCR